MPQVARVVVIGLLAGACGGQAKEYAGSWTRSGGGDSARAPARAPALGIDAFGKMTLAVPAGDSMTTMSGRGSFRGDTLVFPADSSGAECQRAEARYMLVRDSAADALTIRAESADRCPGRAAALPGRWTRRGS